MKIRKENVILPITILSLGLLLMISMSNGSLNRNDTKNQNKVPSLGEAYKDYFTVGTAVSTMTLKDSMAILRIKEQFNAITAENSMKWEKIHPEPGVYDFTNSDLFVDFGVENNMEIIGHVLVWHSQTPAWVFQDADGNNTSRDTLLNRMKDHIQTVMGRYKDRVKVWDVVNEAIDDNAQFRQNIWTQIIGEDYVQKAFEYAREVDPEATLIYNDYSLPTPEKRDAVVNLISGLREKGVKVDVIGLQGHYHLDYPELNDLEQAIIAFSKLGCKVHITELDINVLPNPFLENAGADVRLNFEYDAKWNPWPEALPDSMQTVLAERYVSFFEIFMRHKDVVDRVTFWGVQDGTSWLNYWPIFGRKNYPLLFDRNYQPKKALWALLELTESD